MADGAPNVFLTEFLHKDRALQAVDVAHRRLRASQSSPAAIRAMAHQSLERAIAEADRRGLLLSEEDVASFWMGDASLRLLKARHQVTAASKGELGALAAEQRLQIQRDFLDARAFTKEWGVL